MARFHPRSLIDGGGLFRRVEVEGVSDVTSNPTVFGKPIAGSTHDREDLARSGGDGAIAPERV